MPEADGTRLMSVSTMQGVGLEMTRNFKLALRTLVHRSCATKEPMSLCTPSSVLICRSCNSVQLSNSNSMLELLLEFATTSCAAVMISDSTACERAAKPAVRHWNPR